jgi:hypothetical protein
MFVVNINHICSFMGSTEHGFAAKDAKRGSFLAVDVLAFRWHLRGVAVKY